MKKQGEIRRVDELGRIVIPVEIRELLGIEEKTAVLVNRVDRFITIQKIPEDGKEIEGIKRKFDELGRIVIPIGMRNATGMIEGARVDINLKGETIIIELVQDSCIFCNRKKGLIKFENKFICPQCINKIKNITEI